MKRIIHVLLLSLVSFGFIQSATAQQKSKKPAKNKGENSLLWEISGKDLAQPSYLFGTIHIICKEDFFWEKNFEEALSNTKQLCLEIDMSDQMAMMSAVTMMMDQNGVLLSSFFTTEEQQKLDKLLHDAANISLEQANPFKPMFLISLLATDASKCKNKETEAYESFIMQKAKERSMDVAGIESVNAQIKALSAIDDSSIIQYVKSVLSDDNTKEKKEMDKQMHELIENYKSQNIEALYKLTTSNKQDINMNMNILLNDRNIDWIPKMETMMQSQATFFAFGAAHLAGDQGVIALLKKAGYVVKPIKSAP
jgi:uncharacterized protein YbaP (TraB family)